jgi:hypothetical protein
VSLKLGLSVVSLLGASFSARTIQFLREHFWMEYELAIYQETVPAVKIRTCHGEEQHCAGEMSFFMHKFNWHLTNN